MYIRHATLYVSSVHLVTEILYIYTHTHIIYMYILYIYILCIYNIVYIIIYIFIKICIYIYISYHISDRQNREPLEISNSKKLFSTFGLKKL